MFVFQIKKISRLFYVTLDYIGPCCLTSLLLSSTSPISFTPELSGLSRLRWESHTVQLLTLSAKWPFTTDYPSNADYDKCLCHSSKCPQFSPYHAHIIIVYLTLPTSCYFIKFPSISSILIHCFLNVKQIESG